MPDQFTENTTTSYGDRISNSFGKIVFGFVIFIAAFPLLWWNEGRSLHRIKTLDEGRDLVIAVSADQINPNNNDKLVHIGGNATTNETLNDNMFGVSVNALKLKRIVEVYQWEESSEDGQTHKNLGGSSTKTTTYSYNKVWSSNLINSSKFKHPEGHQNVGSMPYNEELFVAKNIKIGAFELTNNFISQLTWFDTYPLTEQNAAAMNNQLKSYFKLNNGEYFYGDDPVDPKIGSIRIRYTIISPGEISIVGKQENQQIGTYYTANGNINLLEKGIVPANSMFADAETSNTIITWLVRVTGSILMFMGLSAILKPLSILADFVPLFGDVVGAGLGLISSIIAIVCSIVTIGSAWIAYRPLLGCSLLATALILLFGGIGFIVKKAKALKPTMVKPQSSVVRS